MRRRRTRHRTLRCDDMIGRSLDDIMRETDRIYDAPQEAPQREIRSRTSRDLDADVPVPELRVRRHAGFSAQAGLWFNPPVWCCIASGAVASTSQRADRRDSLSSSARSAELDAGAKILDVGAARARRALARVPRIRGDALDPRPYPLSHPRLRSVEGRVEDWDTPDTFDAVICLSTIEHVGARRVRPGAAARGRSRGDETDPRAVAAGRASAFSQCPSGAFYVRRLPANLRSRAPGRAPGRVGDHRLRACSECEPDVLAGRRRRGGGRRRGGEHVALVTAPARADAAGSLAPWPSCFDIQGVQSQAHGERGIARYLLELASALWNGSDPVQSSTYLLNPDLPLPGTIELDRGERADRLQRSCRLRGARASTTSGRCSSTSRSIASGRTQPSARGCAFAVTLYDLIPEIYSDVYLSRTR